MLLFIAAWLGVAQGTTYSHTEERMGQYVNNQLAYAQKYSSWDNIPFALDSCNRFLRAYPKSFIKPTVLTHMLWMTSAISSDPKRIIPLVDSVLTYDSLPTTKFSIAEMLLEKGILQEKAGQLLRESFALLTFSYHKYKSRILFARVEIAKGNLLKGRQLYEQALQEDSTRSEGWMEYAGLLKSTEQPALYRRVMERVRALDMQDKAELASYANNGPNLHKSILKYEFKDIDGKAVDLQSHLGNPILIQTFNFWCPLSSKHKRAIDSLAHRFPQVSILLMNIGESPHELKSRYLNKRENNFFKRYRVVFPDSAMGREIIGQGSRTLFVIDAEGRIRREYRSFRDDFEKLWKIDLLRLSK